MMNLTKFVEVLNSCEGCEPIEKIEIVDNYTDIVHPHPRKSILIFAKGKMFPSKVIPCEGNSDMLNLSEIIGYWM